MKRTFKRFTLRVPADLYAQSLRIAKRHGTSLNALTCAGLKQIATRDAQVDLKAAFDSIGRDAESDAEVFLAAQTEALRGDE
jgi:hypothetical protein